MIIVVNISGLVNQPTEEQYGILRSRLVGEMPVLEGPLSEDDVTLLLPKDLMSHRLDGQLFVQANVVQPYRINPLQVAKAIHRVVTTVFNTLRVVVVVDEYDHSIHRLARVIY